MAGINGAGMNGMAIASADPLSGLARRQYAALIAMRWRMFKNGTRTNQGVLELGARTFSFLIYAMMGLGLSVGLGFGAYGLVANAEWRFFPFLLWAVFLIWQLLPVLLASFQDQFDLSVLLRFPVSFPSYMLLYLLFGLVDVSTITGSLACVGVWVGTTVALPGLFAWTALGLAIFAVFNILLARAIFAWIDRWLAQRRTREIVGGIFLVFVLGLQLLNPAVYEKRHTGPESRQDRMANRQKIEAQARPWLHKANLVQQWLPPGLAAQAVRQAGQAHSAPAWGSLGMLGLWVLAAGGVLAARLKSEYRGESLGEAPSRKRAEARESGRQWGGSGPIAAVIEKDLRALLRTMPLLYAVGAPLLLVLVLSGAFIHGGGPQGHVFAMALPICLVYAQLGFTQVFYNNMGAEGMGIQLYFLAPTPIRTVMLAKNLFHSVLFGLVALTACVITILRLGVPEGAVLAATAAWVLFALPCNLAAGNVFSLTMPYRINPGRITRQRGSQANALLSLLVQMGILGVGAAVFGLTWYLQRLWLAAPIFLVLGAVAVQVWLRVLRNTDAMANQRRDALIEKLAKTA